MRRRSRIHRPALARSLGCGLVTTAIIVSGLALAGAPPASGAAVATPCEVPQPAAPAGITPGAAPDFDARTGTGTCRKPTAEQLGAAAAMPGITVDWDGRYATPSQLIKYGGYLTAADSGSPESIARKFVSEHAVLYGATPGDIAGLAVAANALTDRNGVTQLVLCQTDAGRQVYGSALLFSIDRAGRILTAGGTFFPGVKAPPARTLAAAEAAGRAATAVGARAQGPLKASSAAQATPSAKSSFANVYADATTVQPNPVTATLVTFPMGPGVPARLGWSTQIEVSGTGWYESVVDANSGEVVYRQNYYKGAAEGNVYPCESPAVCAQSTTSFQGDPAFDNKGWVSGVTTSGNNANAFQDLMDSGSPGFQPTTPACPDPKCQHFTDTFTNAYANDPKHQDVTTDRAAVVTQLFWATNYMHDYLYRLGFTESFRNFQVDNFARSGAGNDAVLAEAQDGFNLGKTNNANFATPPDGTSPRMRMFVFTNPPFAWADGSLDTSVVFHEYTHGLSNRLVGGGNLGGGTQTGALGEGWSDSMADSINSNPVIGAYVTGNSTTGIRTVAYNNSTETYGDLCKSGCEPHADGEIWATTLWDMRTALIAKLGAGPGKAAHEQLMVDGMKATSTNPTFLNARDGILAADVANNAGKNQCLIWGVFAKRGMGLSAKSTDPNQQKVTTATDVPAKCGALDLIFAIDTTGSMSPYINGVVGVANIVVDLLSFTGVDYRIGVVDYKDVDSCFPEYDAVTDLAFSHDKAAITGALNSLVSKVGGGCDIPEDVLSGMKRAIDFPWRNGVKKAIIAMGDAPGHDPEPHSGLTSASVIAAAKAVDPAVIYPILVGSNPEATAFMTNLATGTGGMTFDSNASNVGQAVLDAINAILSSSTGTDAPATTSCSTTLTGTISRAIQVTTGTTCLDHANVAGTITVSSGAALQVRDSTVTTISSTGAGAMTVCNSTVKGSLIIQRSTGFVIVGGGVDGTDCAGNTIGGTTTLSGNTGGVELGGNHSGPVVVSGNVAPTGGTPTENSGTEIEANSITGSLACTGDKPSATDDTFSNKVSGGRTGECTGTF